MARIGIAGAGLLGRLAAWELARAGHAVQVWDPAPDGAARHDGRGAAAYTAAGMLSPVAEQETGGAEVARLGWRSIERWSVITAALAQALGRELTFHRRGSLMLAHRSDLGAAQRVLARLDADAVRPQPLDRAALAELEPAVAQPIHAWLLPGEAQIVPAELMTALHDAADGVTWHWGRTVARVEPGRLDLDDGTAVRVDLALDLRGLGARPQLPLRGVRGEIAWLHAPGLALSRPMRLLHPRHRVYLLPRPGDVVVLGASEIESEDRSPVSLRSAVELMAAAHSVLPALAEARIVHLETNLRPALPDNLPHIERRDGLRRINGLFRHGWLLAPALLEDALSDLETTP